ncbi:MAG: heme-binding domain-containing protein [Caldilineaceae bacterium]
MKWVKRIVIALVVIWALLQVYSLVGINRSNPAVVQEVKWDSPATRDLAKRACFDCHSNETTWPWYSYVAPVSVRVANHVDEGRGRLNFSDWTQPNEDFDEIQKVLDRGEMPLWDYLLMHADAKLSAEETQTLLAGLKATYANDPPVKRERRNFGG